MEWRGRAWLATPLYLLAAGLYALILELLALEGRALAHLGLSVEPLQPAEPSDPTLLPTVLAMTVNGILIYVAGALLEHRDGGGVRAVRARPGS